MTEESRKSNSKSQNSQCKIFISFIILASCTLEENQNGQIDQRMIRSDITITDARNNDVHKNRESLNAIDKYMPKDSLTKQQDLTATIDVLSIDKQVKDANPSDVKISDNMISDKPHLDFQMQSDYFANLDGSIPDSVSSLCDPKYALVYKGYAKGNIDKYHNADTNKKAPYKTAMWWMSTIINQNVGTTGTVEIDWVQVYGIDANNKQILITDDNFNAYLPAGYCKIYGKYCASQVCEGTKGSWFKYCSIDQGGYMSTHDISKGTLTTHPDKDISKVAFVYGSPMPRKLIPTGIQYIVVKAKVRTTGAATLQLGYSLYPSTMAPTKCGCKSGATNWICNTGANWRLVTVGPYFKESPIVITNGCGTGGGASLIYSPLKNTCP